MTPEERRKLLEAIFAAQRQRLGEGASREQLLAVWNDAADLVDELSDEEASQAYDFYAVRMPRAAGILGRTGQMDSTTALQHLFSIDPDSAIARADQLDELEPPAPAAKPATPEGALNALEQMLIGGQQGARRFFGRNVLGAVRMADNLTGGDIAPLNRLRGRVDRVQDEWNRDDAAMSPHLGGVGGTASAIAEMLGEGSMYMLGGRMLSGASPTYARLYQAGEGAVGWGGRGMLARMAAGAPINAAQALIDNKGNTKSPMESIGVNVGVGGIADALGQPVIQGLGRTAGRVFRSLTDARVPSRTLSSRVPEAPEIDNLVEEIMARRRNPSRPVDLSSILDLRDDIDRIAPVRRPPTP